MNRWERFGWGCAGGLIPYAIQWSAVAIADRTTELPSVGLGFIAAVVFFVLLGGLWSLALKSDEIWLGIYHGASAPLAASFLSHVLGGTHVPPR